MLALSNEMATNLMERYGLRREGVDSAWAFAWARIEGQVSARYLQLGNIPRVFEAAAVLHVAAICAPNAQEKQALLYAAAELTGPFCSK